MGSSSDRVAATWICITVRVLGPYPGWVVGAPPVSSWLGSLRVVVVAGIEGREGAGASLYTIRVLPAYCGEVDDDVRPLRRPE